MSILCDVEIRKLCANGLIEPFDDNQIQPASYDVKLGGSFRVFVNDSTFLVDLGDPSTYDKITEERLVPPGDGFVLHPGEFVLGTTEETVFMPDDLVARIEGRSSLGRLGLIVHSTAGYIDPGFQGTITLEMTNLLRVPIVLRPGISIGQISFTRMDQPAAKPYRGKYQGDKGANPSRYEGLQ